MNLFSKCSLAFGLLLAIGSTGCSNLDDKYDPSAKVNEEIKSYNDFDFSTSQQVDLKVNYTQLGVAKSQIFFEVYAENPLEFNGESYQMKENALSLYGGYTDSEGAFNKTITLPAYAKNLYIVTPAFYATQLLTATVSSGQAVATDATTKAITRATGTAGKLTTDLPSTLKANYNNTFWGSDWRTWLGSFDSYSGHPSYIMAKSPFETSEIQGLYEAVANSVNISKSCPENLRASKDLELTKDSPVSITMLGGNTCWNSSLGYYYYTGAAPTSSKGLNIILLFPNTQDGQWTNNKTAASVYVGVNRGESVQLMYYPNIATGSNADATETFPKGTKIGFVLVTNSWYNQVSGFTGDKKFFGCTTPGLGTQNKDSKNRHVALFQYESAKMKTYPIVSFEDYNNDQNFSDVAFALNPNNVFQDLPVVKENTTETKSVYAFEDLWPEKGDYDMNDVLTVYTYEKTFKTSYKSETSSEILDKKLIKENLTFKTFQNYAANNNGLAFRLKTNQTNKPTVTCSICNAGGTEFQSTTYTTEADGDYTIYLLTDNVKTNMGAQYRVTLDYGDTGKGNTDEVVVKPFIYKNEDGGRWEVHVPYEAPTSKMITSYFGTTENYNTIKAGNLWYLSSATYPFAFCLEGCTETDIAPLLKSSNEKTPIDQLYSKFMGWVNPLTRAANTDWYKYPKE